ncbi:MAG: heavy metal translocating P-type ATPase [Clostridia bacterium]|nr:heavy metal translocating P-type ATPase [Clostridia bacterium]
MKKKHKIMLIRILLSAGLTVLANIVPIDGMFRFFAFAGIYILIGYDILRKCVKGIANGRFMDENFLMTIATIGAFAIAIYEKSGDYNEAVAVMLLYQTGELFQGLAVAKSRRSIGELMDIRPDYANIEKDGDIVKVSPDEVSPGSIITVFPGEKIPIDGIIDEGKSEIDTKALTGESLPRSIEKGAEVASGCINLTGVLKVRTTKDFGDSTVSKILELVENASMRKAKSEKFISKFAKIYTPIVCISALLLGAMPPLASLITTGEADFITWIYRALTFLVISCPCALVISVPLSFFAGIGGASREGILIKGSSFIETVAKIKYMVFDKTGTLTEGTFSVTGIKTEGISEEWLVECAAHVESFSKHPIAKSIVSEYKKEIDLSRVSDVRELGGEGIMAKFEGHEVALGNSRLAKRLGAGLEEKEDGNTRVYAFLDGEYKGAFLVADRLKAKTKEAISEMKKLGVKKCIMLTGDTKAVAEKIAAEAGIDEFESDLMPSDKVKKVEKLLAVAKQGEKLAFAGDGINDAPVLARADVGIAMGAMGSDAAIEASDVVIMDDDPLKIARAVKISRKCMKIVKENIMFSLLVKVLCLILVALGYAGMWLGIFADVGVMVLAVLNSVRAMKVKK